MVTSVRKEGRRRRYIEYFSGFWVRENDVNSELSRFRCRDVRTVEMRRNKHADVDAINCTYGTITWKRN